MPSLPSGAHAIAGSLEKLVGGLDGSMSQRDASLESIATILKNNPGAVSKFVELQNGRALRSVIELTRDRFSRTMLSNLYFINDNYMLTFDWFKHELFSPTLHLFPKSYTS